ncbi:hypothetical protein CROQUDRAFT_240773 [Cronartium quercuum f. sp. fusiforme G11]|uniref:Uncharacterized protein n=1 Tax=Cronartium quercuum f. sp. fusiforme G11 TaxID=708437 RepID=A0A9P6NE04_9BASI|nr:hypothetical protein CROQUDRAFT_240773 [Cronartium quercuum f. sp. fusiforme G11]
MQGHPKPSAGNVWHRVNPPLSFDFLPQPLRLIGPDSPSPLPFHPITSTSPFTNQPTITTLVHLTSQLNVVHSTDWFSLTSDCSSTIVYFAGTPLHFHLPKEDIIHFSQKKVQDSIFTGESQAGIMYIIHNWGIIRRA